MGSTSIIILVHNQLQLTQQCLASIERFTPEPHEIILVDNGSDEETGQWLRSYVESHSGTKLIVNNRNRGFAGGNNLGLAISEGDYVLLLNNDVLVTPGWLASMQRALTENEKLGYAGPVSNRVAGKQKLAAVYATGDEMLSFAAKLAAEQAGKTIRENRLIGFCLLLKREVVDRIGALDSGFGTGNFEDDDYCLRAYYSGYEGVIACDSFVHHEGSKTFAGMGIDYQAKMHVNQKIFHGKWGLDFVQGGYLWPDSPLGVDPERCFIPIPDLAATHKQDADGVWVDQDASPVPKLSLVIRADWAAETLESATAEAICDAFDEAGQVVARVSSGLIAAAVPAFSLTAKPQLKAASHGPLALMLFAGAARALSANQADEIRRKADRVFVPDQAALDALAAAGLPEDLAELLPFGPEHTLPETISALEAQIDALQGVTPIAQLRPLEIDGRKQTLLAVSCQPATDDGWQPAVLAYAQAFNSDDPVTLAVPCLEGEEEQVTGQLLALLEQHNIDLETLADVIVLASDNDTSALQLAADAIIKTPAPAGRGRTVLAADVEALRSFVGC